MSCVIEKDVFRFQVTVDDLEAVQALECAEQFSCIETRSVDVESLLSLKVMEELPAVHERQDEV
jgi:hypothetical protein